jgi:hypothetical protein
MVGSSYHHQRVAQRTYLEFLEASLRSSVSSGTRSVEEELTAVRTQHSIFVFQLNRRYDLGNREAAGIRRDYHIMGCEAVELMYDLTLQFEALGNTRSRSAPVHSRWPLTTLYLDNQPGARHCLLKVVQCACPDFTGRIHAIPLQYLDGFDGSHELLLLRVDEIDVFAFSQPLRQSDWPG